MTQPAVSPPAPGQPAPPFALPDATGRLVRLEDFHGRWLVLYFYPKDDTPGCTREACDFNAARPVFEGLGAAVVGVSPDPPERHARFAAKHGLGLTLLGDPAAEVIRSYGAWGIKKMYGREAEGVIRRTVLVDPRGWVAHVWPKVRVDGHAEAVRQTLAELQAGGEA